MRTQALVLPPTLQRASERENEAKSKGEGGEVERRGGRETRQRLGKETRKGKEVREQDTYEWWTLQL